MCDSTNESGYIFSGLGLYIALNTCGQVYFGVISQGWQVTALPNLTNWKYMPHGTWTHISHKLGEHLNHLDHRVHWFPAGSN